LPISPAEALKWITGHASGDVATSAALAEIVVHRFVLRTRRKDEAKVLDTLRMGGKGWSLSEEQVAGQNGWEPKKARSALKRLEERQRPPGRRPLVPGRSRGRPAGTRRPGLAVNSLSPNRPRLAPSVSQKMGPVTSAGQKRGETGSRKGSRLVPAPSPGRESAKRCSGGDACSDLVES
jgi:hypothetical protein